MGEVVMYDLYDEGGVCWKVSNSSIGRHVKHPIPTLDSQLCKGGKDIPQTVSV